MFTYHSAALCFSTSNSMKAIRCSLLLPTPWRRRLVRSRRVNMSYVMHVISLIRDVTFDVWEDLSMCDMPRGCVSHYNCCGHDGGGPCIRDWWICYMWCMLYRWYVTWRLMCGETWAWDNMCIRDNLYIFMCMTYELWLVSHIHKDIHKDTYDKTWACVTCRVDVCLITIVEL